MGRKGHPGNRLGDLPRQGDSDGRAVTIKPAALIWWLTGLFTTLQICKGA